MTACAMTKTMNRGGWRCEATQPDPGRVLRLRTATNINKHAYEPLTQLSHTVTPRHAQMLAARILLLSSLPELQWLAVCQPEQRSVARKQTQTCLMA